MEDNIIDKVIENLSDSLERKEKFIKLPYENYKGIEISSKNFHEIKCLDRNKIDKNKIAFIDGGNAEILKASNFSLQFVRIYYTIYEDNKRVKNKKYEFYLLVNSFEKDEKIFYKTTLFGDKIIEGAEFDSFDKTLTQGINRCDISFIGNVARRFSELSIAKKLVEVLDKNDLIVLDGSLEAKYTNEKRILDEIYDNALDKGIILGGLSKTCELFTDRGGSALGALSRIQPKNEWYYHPIGNHNQKHDLVFVKLNEKSRYIFRFDILKKQVDDLDRVLRLLKLNSGDPVFIGYPYGLIEADRFARVSNKELELLKTKFMIKAGKNWNKINNLLKTKDSHNVLDRIG